MKNKLMSSILICIICVSCLVLFGCTGTSYSKLRGQVPEEYLDEVIAWGPGITINIALYEPDKPLYFFKYEDICNLKMISNEDLKKIKNSLVFTRKYKFTIDLGINDGEDVIRICCHSTTPLLQTNKIEIFKSTLNFKFKDMIAEMEELTGIEMTQEILNPKSFSREVVRFSEESGDYEYYRLPAGINFNVLNDSEYTFDFIYVDDNSIEYHVYR